MIVMDRFLAREGLHFLVNALGEELKAISYKLDFFLVFIKVEILKQLLLVQFAPLTDVELRYSVESTFVMNFVKKLP